MFKPLRVPLIVATALVAGMAVLPQESQAQPRGRSSARAVPRSAGPRSGRPVIVTTRPVGRPYYYAQPYWPGSFAVGYPVGYGGFGWYGYGYPSYGSYGGYHGYSGYGYPGYGGYGGYAGGYRPYGGVRIQLARRQAEVWVSGYFVGHVDDFDGAFQQLNLEPGAHRIEIREAGYETIAFDVRIEPGRTIHYRSDMKPVP